jgi:hypothetical protein
MGAIVKMLPPSISIDHSSGMAVIASDWPPALFADPRKADPGEFRVRQSQHEPDGVM